MLSACKVLRHTYTFDDVIIIIDTRGICNLVSHFKSKKSKTMKFKVLIPSRLNASNLLIDIMCLDVKHIDFDACLVIK